MHAGLVSRHTGALLIASRACAIRRSTYHVTMETETFDSRFAPLASCSVTAVKMAEQTLSETSTEKENRTNDRKKSKMTGFRAKKPNCGHRMVIMNLMVNNENLKRKNRILKKRLSESEKTCKNCEEFRKERDVLTRKCQNYELMFEQFGNTDAQKGSLLKETQQENIRLNKLVAQLAQQIVDKNLLRNDMGTSPQKEVPNVEPQQTTESRLESCGRIRYVASEDVRVKKEVPRDEFSLYEQCRNATASVDNATRDVETRSAFEMGILEPIAVIDADADFTQDGRCFRFNEDAETESDREEYNNNMAENSDEFNITQACMWMDQDVNGGPKTCGKVFGTVSDLASHLTKDHVHASLSGGYVCYWDGCKREGVAFRQKCGLVSHFRCHSGEKPYKCPYEGCGKSFSQIATVKWHQSTHIGKVVPCTYPGCDKVFSHKCTMRLHYGVRHTADRGFRCTAEGCGSIFHKAAALRRHMVRHTGERPHVCEFEGCGKTFAYQAARTRHYQKHMTGSCFRCPVDGCGVRYATAKEYLGHVSDAHGNGRAYTQFRR